MSLDALLRGIHPLPPPQSQQGSSFPPRKAIPPDPQRLAARQAFVYLARRFLDIRQELVSRLLRKPGAETRFYAGLLAEIGPSALSLIIERLRQTTVAQHRVRLIYTLGRFGPKAADALPMLLALLKEDPQHLRFAIVSTVGHFREKGVPAIPALLELLRSEKTFQEAILFALGRIGPPALPALLGLFQENDPLLSSAVCRALGWMGPRATRAVPALLLRLIDPDRGVRHAAAAALAKIGPPALPLLRQTLAFSKDVRWQTNAAYALALMGEAALPALPELQKALVHPAWQIRRTAAFALEKIGPKARSALPLLEKRSKDLRPEVRFFVLRALQSIGFPQPRFRRALLAASPLPFPEGAIFLSKELHKVGEIEGSFESLHQLLLQATYPAKHLLLFQQMETLAKELLPYAPRLIQLLRRKDIFQKDPYLDKRIALLLPKLGYMVLPLLFEPLGKEPTSWFAARLLFAIQAFPKRMPVMQRILASFRTHGSAEVRLHAARALGTSWGRHEETILYLLPFLSDPDPRISLAALQGIRFQRSSQPRALRIFASALLTFPPEGRVEAALAIRNWPSPPVFAFPALLQGLRDPEAAVRIPVLHALRRLGPKALPALPLIAEALVDVFPEVVLEAKQTYRAVAFASPAEVRRQTALQMRLLFGPLAALVPPSKLRKFLALLSSPPAQRAAFFRSLAAQPSLDIPLVLLALLQSPWETQYPLLQVLQAHQASLEPWLPSLLLAFCRTKQPTRIAASFAPLLGSFPTSLSSAFLSLLAQPRRCRASALASLLHALHPASEERWPLLVEFFGSRSEIYPLSLFFKEKAHAPLEPLALAARHPLPNVREGAFRVLALSSLPAESRMPLILEGLRDPSIPVRLRAVRALGTLSLPWSRLQSLLHFHLAEDSAEIVAAASLILRGADPPLPLPSSPSEPAGIFHFLRRLLP